MLVKNKVLLGACGFILVLIGVLVLLRAWNTPKKYYRADFMTQFNIEYLEEPKVKATEILACNLEDDEFYQSNEDSCQTLSTIYGELIDKQYVAPVYVAYVNDKVGYGLFAEAPLKKGEMIGEYTGELISDDQVTDGNAYLFYYPSKIAINQSFEHDVDEKNKENAGNVVENTDADDVQQVTESESENIQQESDHEQATEREYYVDAERSGNYTRFANHARPSNAERRYVPHNGKWRIIFIAVQDIAKDEQIFIDYGDGYWVDSEPDEIAK